VKYLSKILITNNPLVFKNYSAEYQVEFHEVGYLKILEIVRDRIHVGHKLLSHPLSSSLKPNETPYKTIIVLKDKGSLDVDSVMIIEGSIQTANKFIKDMKTPNWNQKALDDFQAVDYSLIQNTLSRNI
jgi:hypothetical protein